MLFLWRLAYTTLISSPRFYKKVLLVGEISNIENIIKPLKETDPNYKIIGFINCEKETDAPIKFKGLKEFQPYELMDVIQKYKISEILVASYDSETITPEIYHDLITFYKISQYFHKHNSLFAGILMSKFVFIFKNVPVVLTVERVHAIHINLTNYILKVSRMDV